MKRSPTDRCTACGIARVDAPSKRCRAAAFANHNFRPAAQPRAALTVSTAIGAVDHERESQQ